MARALLLLVTLLGLVVWTQCMDMHMQKKFGDLDGNDDIDEDQFEKIFHLPEVTDPVEKARRQEALKANEEKVKKENEAYLEGKSTWFDKIEDFDDLPDDEFKRAKLGDNTFEGRGRKLKYTQGVINPPWPESKDEASERYFDRFRYSRAYVPYSVNSVEKGDVSPVKNQASCGACVAFANMALIETCFKKKAGIFGDYSEQQLLDCGYGRYGNGCKGAASWAYAKMVADKQLRLAGEIDYPYKTKVRRQSCPDKKPYNQGVKVTNSWYTMDGDEETLKRLVAEHGIVGTSVAGKGNFQLYDGGIFAAKCSKSTTHSVAVVGYGSEGGVDYWIVKNSWGPYWGEKGFIRMKRGVSMCGIGQTLVTVECESVPGSTDTPTTTKKPCFDKFNDCNTVAIPRCFKWKKECPKTCGLCEGQTPHPSNTCPDNFSDCAKVAKTSCWNEKIKKNCCYSCGLGEGMTPVESNTCYNKWSERGCKMQRSWVCTSPEHKDKCKKTCGKC